MTMMARKRSPIPRLADDYSREAAAKRIDFVGAATGARPAYIGSYSLDPAAVAGNVEIFLRFNYPTGDAAGQNMTGKATARACGWIIANYPGVRRSAEIAAATTLRGQLSLGSAIVAGKRVGAHERLGRNRPALRGCNSEKEASWTG